MADLLLLRRMNETVEIGLHTGNSTRCTLILRRKPRGAYLGVSATKARLLTGLLCE